MNFAPNEIYHIYNRGNQKQLLFKSRDNYLYFLEKIQKNIKPRCDILAWCLMPNHFHLLVNTTEESIRLLEKTPISIQSLAEGIRLQLSSYTKGFNKANGLTGNLFQQKTKARLVSDRYANPNYSTVVFHYIHQNPMTAGLVKKMEDWEFSSFRDYINMGGYKLCNKKLAFELLDLDERSFYKESYTVIPQEKQDKLSKGV